MVLQFVGEYVVAFLRKTLHENEGFFVFMLYDVFALRALFVPFFVLKMFWYFARKDAKTQRRKEKNSKLCL